MQHAKLLELVENDIASMDLDHLKRARLLLQSDLYSAERGLDDRKRLTPVRVAELEEERDRIGQAIYMISDLIEKDNTKPF